MERHTTFTGEGCAIVKPSFLPKLVSTAVNTGKLALGRPCSGFCCFFSPPVLLCLWVSDRLSPASLQVDQCLCERPGGFPFFILPRPGACDSVAGSLIVTKSCKARRCA